MRFLLSLISTLSLVSFTLAWTTYIVPSSGGKSDDTPALAAALSTNPSLATDATIIFKKGVTYNILTPIVFPRLQNVLVSIQGNLSWASDIKATQAIVGSKSFPGHWFTFNGGSNVTLEGSTDPNWGWVNSYGQKWWDVMQDLSKQVNRPHGWSLHKITDGEIRYMKLWQPVAWSFSCSGSKNLRFHHNEILAISTSGAKPYNTDGFAAQGENIQYDNNIVYNGDDCVNVVSPAKNIHVRDSYCNGGHGASVGSLGKDGDVADVQNVLFENITLESSLFGARFKSWVKGQGAARNITWRNIHMKSVTRPIWIDQDYYDKEKSAKSDSGATSSTHIDTMTFQNIDGTLNDAKKARAVATVVLFKGAHTGILLKGITVKTVSGAPVTVVCDPTQVPYDIGVKCVNGAFQPTAAGV